MCIQGQHSLLDAMAYFLSIASWVSVSIDSGIKLAACSSVTLGETPTFPVPQFPHL